MEWSDEDDEDGDGGFRNNGGIELQLHDCCGPQSYVSASCLVMHSVDVHPDILHAEQHQESLKSKFDHLGSIS